MCQQTILQFFGIGIYRRDKYNRKVYIGTRFDIVSTEIHRQWNKSKTSNFSSD